MYEIRNNADLKKQYLGIGNLGDSGQVSVSKDNPVGMGDVNGTYPGNTGVGNGTPNITDAPKVTSTNWEDFFGTYKNSNEYKGINDFYNKYITDLGSNYNKSVENHNNMKAGDIASLTQARDYQQGLLNNLNAEAQKAAYIQKRQNEKSLPLIMAAQGFTGGMTESAATELMSAYQNARIKNDGELSKNTAALGQTYNTNVSDANKYYASILSQLENAYNKDKMTANTDLENRIYDRGRTAYQDVINAERQAELNRQWQSQFDRDGIWRGEDLAYRDKRDGINDKRYQEKWDYDVKRDGINDERYQEEWNYGVKRDDISDSWKQREWDHMLAQSAMANVPAPASSGGGGSTKTTTTPKVTVVDSKTGTDPMGRKYTIIKYSNGKTETVYGK